MSEDPTILAESLAAEETQAAAVHTEAAQKADTARMHATVSSAMTDILPGILRQVLTDPDGSPLLIKRIPFICNDIKWIKLLLWVILSANGAVLLALIGVAIQRAFS